MGICGQKCSVAVDCQAGFACVAGTCRNPACTADGSCFCKGVVAAAATASAIVKKAPETGVEVWLGMVAMVAMGVAGLKVRRQANKLWGS